MKTLLCSIFLMMGLMAFSQENKFEFTTGYGLFYNEFNVSSDIPNLDYTTPNIGKTFEFAIDYALPNNKYIGFGYATQSNTSIINDNVLLQEGIGLAFDGFRLEYENQFYDIHFRKEFHNRIYLTAGLFWYRYFSGDLGFSQAEEVHVTFKNNLPKADDAGISIAMDYFFPVKDYFEFGFRGRLFYSLVGLEAITLAPVLKFAF